MSGTTKSISTAMAVIIAIILAIIGGVAGYFMGSSTASTVTVTETKTGTGAPTSPSQQYVLHVAWITAPSPYDTHTYFFYRFKEKVESRTNGRVQIVLHPGGELGDQSQYLELMKTGDLFMATIEVSRFSSYTNALNFLSYPGLFRSTDEAMAFAESDWLLNYSNQVLNQYGWVVLGITVGGARYFLSVPEKPITSLDSFNGLKLRVMGSPVYVEAAQALGANPQTLPYSECYTLLQTKAIDAMENEVAAIIAMRFYEVAPNIALIPWAYAWHFVVASKKILDNLPSDIRQIIIDAAKETSSEKNAWGLFIERVTGVQFLVSHGARIIQVDTKPIFDRLEQGFLSKHLNEIPEGARQWLQNYRSSTG